MFEDLHELGVAIDAAGDTLNRQALGRLRKDCAKRLQSATGPTKVVLYYFKANVHAHLGRCAHQDGADQWSWQSQHRVDEILCLRQAIQQDAFVGLDTLFQCRIRTNLGNTLSFLGRAIAAIEQWDLVIALRPRFAMALGNRAKGLAVYGRNLYDKPHGKLLLQEALASAERALASDADWDEGERAATQDIFRRYRMEFIAYLNQEGLAVADACSLGRGQEHKYRDWAMTERLYLNPLNDAGIGAVAARDVMHLPSHVYGLDEEPRFPAYFNLLKQEFVSARYRLYNALFRVAPAYVDRDILLFDMGDGAEYGHRTEELKSAFRAGYATFDKIALFLNDYFQLGVSPGQVSLRKLWWAVDEDGKRIGLHAAFQGSQNLPLRGLYYLSKDLFEDSFTVVAEPDGRELALLRNRLEHRFLGLQDSPLAKLTGGDMHVQLGSEAFARKTLRLLKLAREALIYLSMTMFREEELRRERNGGDKPRLPFFSPRVRPRK